MSRGLATNITTELAKNGFRLATLVDLTLRNSTGTFNYRETDYGITLTDTDLQVYTNQSNLIEVGDVSETGALKVNEITLTFSGADQTMISAFLNESQTDQPVAIRRALVDASDNVINSFSFFDGYITTFAIEDTERESQIRVNIASHWADFEKIKNRRTNLNSQQVYFPSDMGFQYASKIVKDLRWGRK
jgi:hypothetical protein